MSNEKTGAECPQCGGEGSIKAIDAAHLLIYECPCGNMWKHYDPVADEIGKKILSVLQPMIGTIINQPIVVDLTKKPEGET